MATADELFQYVETINCNCRLLDCDTEQIIIYPSSGQEKETFLLLADRFYSVLSCNGMLIVLGQQTYTLYNISGIVCPVQRRSMPN